MSQASSPALQQALFAVGDALRRGDVSRAMLLSDQAVGQGFEDVNLLTLAGQHRMRLGQFEQALPVLVRARALGARNIEALNGLGMCLGMLGRSRESVAIFDEAVAVSPTTPYLRLHRSQSLEDAGRLREAQADLEKALAAQSANVQALGRIANLCARRGGMAAARDYATRALKAGPLAAATIALAMAELADGKFDAVRTLMTPVTTDSAAGPVNHAIAFGLLGDALDGEGRPAEAFAMYSRGRDILRGMFAERFGGSESAISRVQRLTEYFHSAPMAPWAAHPADDASPVHAFLVGFPRSGTTLLEQALASHHDVRTMEEIDCLGDTVGEYFYALGGMQRFAALDEADLAKLRAQYWQRVAAAGAKTDRRVFIDKMPLNSVHQAFIARLFPQAKILFALRDPRDVVLSCFRRRLVMSAHMYELSRFEGAATFYDAVMTLAEIYRARLGLPTLDVRNEDIIADFDGQMRRVCEFLGLPWDDAMRDFAVHARDRDIKTPSANQVVRGLNGDGAGQWRKYREQFAPILPVLNPWVERFGYEA